MMRVGISVCLLIGLLVGCGPRALPTGSVSGTVTYNGQALTSGTVTFIDQEAGIGASAELDSSGNYRLESIPTGNYQVAIQPPSAPSPEEMEAGAKPVALNIPDKYQQPQASSLTATIEKGSNAIDFNLE